MPEKLKTIPVKKDTHTKLIRLKIELEAKTMDNVICLLLDKYKQFKNVSIA